MQSMLPTKDDRRSCHSSNVRIQLRTERNVFEPIQTTPEELFFREPVTIPQSSATLVIEVDEEVFKSELEILPYEAPSDKVPVRIIKTLEKI